MVKIKERIYGKLIYLIGLVLILSFNSAYSKGGKEDYLISPFPGSSLKCKYVLNFDEYLLPLGKINKNGKFTKSKKLEGKIIQYTYSVSEKHSVFEVYKNYEQALKSAGFEILFTLNKEEEPHWSKWTDLFFSSTHRNDRAGQDIKYSLHYANEGAFISAKLPREQGDIYVAICIAKGNWHNYITIQQDIIELKELQTGLIKVNAKVLKDNLNKKGHVPVYQIYFDFNKSSLKPESEPAIREIAKLLKQNPKLKLYIVGHTDNIGNFDYNLKLSKKRAEAVVNRLVNKYKISPDRLKAFGVGPLCPVESNDTEQGRAKNRRVELVKQ